MFDNAEFNELKSLVEKVNEELPKPIGKLEQVIVRLTHNGVTSDYTFQVSPTAGTAIVELNLDQGGLKK